jgi:transposase
MNKVIKAQGRPPKFNQSRNAIKRILEALATGESIRKAIAKENLSWNTFRKWMNEKPELREQYEQAKSDGIHYTLDAVEDQCKDMIKSANDKTANLNSIKALE